MGSRTHKLHVFFFPFLAQGHLRPTIDMAKLFASRGLKSTIITTSYFAQSLSKSIEQGTEIDFLTVKIPTAEVGLPEGTESLHMAHNPDMFQKFIKASGMLGPQLDELLKRHRPECLVADIFFPWAIDVAATYGIPGLLFHGTGYFALCALLCLYLYEPQKKVLSDSEPFVIPNFPGDIEFTRNRIPESLKQGPETEFAKAFKEMKEVELRSYGVVVNSFYELEPAYADHYTKVLGVRAWHIGPLFLNNKGSNPEKRSERLDQHYCLKWLDSKKPNSVIYVCFGSLRNFNDAQLIEIALGLQSSGQQFIWVVRKEKKEEDGKEEWLPEGFENRVEGKGLIIRGWAPQVMILVHEAIGGFVTHCGWNSTLEGVCAGLPLVTWPLAAEQFYNEKLLTQILRIGVGVGVQTSSLVGGDFVRREVIERAVSRVMEGEEAEEMRSRARKLAEMGRRAIEEGGSSYLDLDGLIADLRLHSAK